MQSTIAIPGSEDFCCVFLVEAFFKLWTTINHVAHISANLILHITMIYAHFDFFSIQPL